MMGEIDEANLDKIIDELQLRPLLVVGSSRAGKTLMVKALVKRLKERGVKQVTVYDPSLAWWNNSPLSHRKTCTPLTGGDYPEPFYDFVCDVSKFIGDERASIISGIIEHEYEERVNQRRVSGEEKTFPANIAVLEEAQTIFKKFGIPGTRLYDWVSMGLNFNMTGIYTTQRPAEVPTEIVERCNLLVGYIDGHRNLQKIRGAVKSLDFIKTIHSIKQRSYEFAYYDGGKGFKVKAPNEDYGDPKTVFSRRPPLPPNIGATPVKTQKIGPNWWWLPVMFFGLLILAAFS